MSPATRPTGSRIVRGVAQVRAARCRTVLPNETQMVPCVPAARAARPDAPRDGPSVMVRSMRKVRVLTRYRLIRSADGPAGRAPNTHNDPLASATDRTGKDGP